VTEYRNCLFSTVFGDVSIVWREEKQEARIYRVFLPSQSESAAHYSPMRFPDAVPQTCPSILKFGRRIQLFIEGNAVDFNLDTVAIERCSDFQKRVLLAEYGIPRGRVSTYGRIADYIGVPNGARAVGSALAQNPFPIIIPCHRAVTSAGSLGGFQGGLAMKRHLLESEGIDFTADGNIRTKKYYY